MIGHQGRSARVQPHWPARVAVSLCVALLVSLAITVAPASASTSTLTTPTTLSGDSALDTNSLFDQTVLGVHVTGATSITMHWSQPAEVDTTFDPNLVRQGRSLDPTDAYSRTAPGTMSIDYSANFSVDWGVGTFSFTPTITTTGSCDLKADGSAYVCPLTSSSTLSLLDTFPIPGPYVKLRLDSDVTITPQAVASLRQATFGGNADGTASLSLPETPITDTFPIPCTVGKGDELIYSLGQLSTTPGVSVDTGLAFEVGAELPTPITVFPEIDIPFAKPTIPLGTTTGSIGVTGGGETLDLGAVQPNNIPPSVDAGGSYSGNEGSAISFDGSGSSSICGFPTLRWDFSDGGVAFGKFPQHPFADNGLYSGLLTATDSTGLASTTTFTISVANLPPSVDAGPDTTETWGTPVAFNGQATDPGPADQSTLQYTWDFGDGSPSASGGPSVSHPYAMPGTYTATLTVRDKDGGVNSDTRQVVVTKRSTTIGYTGPLSSLPSKNVTLSASLTDQYGQAVQGRLVQFTLGGQSASATTNSAGVAQVTIKLNQKKGVYPLGASFADDAKYTGSSGNGSFAIG
jgi:PKD repeat protein